MTFAETPMDRALEDEQLRPRRMGIDILDSLTVSNKQANKPAIVFLLPLKEDTHHSYSTLACSVCVIGVVRFMYCSSHLAKRAMIAHDCRDRLGRHDASCIF